MRRQKRIRIGGYRRSIACNLDRMFENVFDWEHLPHLHPTSFVSVRCLHAGSRSLVCDIGLWPRGLGLKQRIQVHACQRRQLWLVTIKEGFMQGLTIRSRVSVRDANVFDVSIDFLVPRQRWYWLVISPLLWLSYRKIYQEDSSMMVTRQQQLNKRRQSSEPPADRVLLGERASIQKQLPYFFDWNGHAYGLIAHEDGFLAYDAVCPHMLRPLHDCPIRDLTLRCPWHGYEFSIVTGKAKGHSLRLRPAPHIISEGRELYATRPRAPAEPSQ